MMLTDQDGEHVLRIAVRAVEEPLRTGRRWLPAADELDGPLADPSACFVTLRRDGALLGCIGSLAAHRPLGIDVAHNAAAAAFDDPRLPPVTRVDVPHMHVHVSVLTALAPMDVEGWHDLAARLRPGVDGLLVHDERHRATFLPSVWQQLPGPPAFLDALWAKAGLRPGAWPEDMQVSRYEVHDVEGWASRYALPG